MAGSRQKAPDPGTALERDDVVATKVSIPRIRPDSLRRSRLLQALDEVSARELTLLCTPAGFGKTTLLADWARDTQMPVAWVSLDQDDNDPARFWRHVVAAMERAGAKVGERVLSVLDPRAGASSRGIAAALINEVAALPEELALVLDDYHVVASRSIHEGLAFLLDHPSPQLHVILAGRSDPPLPLARLRARDQLAELRAADLRFTAEEVAAFLGEVWGLDLPSEAVASLEARTEGWAVGLQLAALSLRERPDPGAFVEAFTGTHRYVLDYLGEEVLQRQPERVRTFLLRTSILQRLAGPLCDAVTGGSGGQAMLEDLDRANVFLMPLDEERRWYRFHHLFADLLRAQLDRAEGALVPELHGRAAAWFEQHGAIDEAIRHALASGEATRAARLVEEHLGETLRRGEGVILERWLSALPEEVVLSRSGLCLAQALIHLHVGWLESVDRLLDHAERVFVALPEPQRHEEVPTAGGMVIEVGAAIALLRAELAEARGDADEVARHARSALAQLGEDEHGPRFLARWYLPLADWMRGQMEDAESSLAEMLAEGRAAPDPHPLMTSCWLLGRVQRGRGELGAALRTYREGLRLATAVGHSTFHAAEAHVGIAQALYERNELDDALRHVTEGIELGRQVVEFRLPAVGLVTRAWIHWAAGDAGRALDAMNEAISRTHPSPHVASLANPIPAEQARLLLALGRLDQAALWTEERGLRDEDDPSYPWELEYLVLARVLLARSDPGPALGLLERLEALAESQGRRESLIQIRALRSLALKGVGDHRGALSSLTQALSLARPEGYLRVFADEGPAMAALLRSLLYARQRGRVKGASRAAQEFLVRVVRAFGPGRGQEEAAPNVAGTGLIDPLTDREVEVLRLVAAGRKNREIAGELVVTLDTVKKHVSHIFEKLGAANRTEAVARAREVGLLP